MVPRTGDLPGAGTGGGGAVQQGSRQIATGAGRAPRALTRREKAAVIVRLLLAEGDAIDLSRLPEDHQTALTETIGALKVVDRATLMSVVREFHEDLQSVGLAFPGELDRALDLLDGKISPTAADRLRRKADRAVGSDPWERLAGVPSDHLLKILDEESTEVCAVLISKLPVGRGAELLARLPGERARRVAHSVSLTESIDPETVRRIGAALVLQLTNLPQRAFRGDSASRVGALLNHASAATRESLLDGLEVEDAGFAEQVRKAIFTFVHIPERIAPRDVPLVTRGVEQPVLITALAGCNTPETAAVRDFILSNISQRLAETMREDIAAMGKVRERKAEEAMTAVITAIRALEEAGTLTLTMPDEGD